MKHLYFSLTIGVLLFSACFLFSCSSSSDEETTPSSKPLAAIDDVSLSYKPSTESVTLSRDAEAEGAIVKLKKGVSWINNVHLSGNKIFFDVEENTTTMEGHRFDTICVVVNGQIIGKVCVSQARNSFSEKRLAWATSQALYQEKALSDKKLSGLEMTKLVYNLEKTTGGKDSYKNYPAFAFCIEMNHDPEHHMEWYLPSEDEIRSYAQAQSYKGTPIARHNYWWSSTENTYNGTAFNVYSGSVASRGSVSKSGEWWVAAFRNGKIEE